MSIDTLYIIVFIIACTISYFWGKKVGRDELAEIGRAYEAGLKQMTYDYLKKSK